MNGKTWISSINGLFCAVTLVTALGATGCQISESGQTLPSPWYIDDDVQYYAPDTEFKLPREAAAMAAAKADAALR
jgi:hypothetical protein